MHKKSNNVNKMLTLICVGIVILIVIFCYYLKDDTEIQPFRQKIEQSLVYDHGSGGETENEIQLFQSDPYDYTQWNLHNGGRYVSYRNESIEIVNSVKDIDMDVYQAWTYQKGLSTPKREVIVAIIDTGVDYRHPDLVDHMWINQDEIPGDEIDNDNNGYIDDVYGWDFYNNDGSVGHYQWDDSTKSNRAHPKDNDDHGTHIAGIIGAVKENGIGIAGIASNIDIKLMVLKINGGSKGNGSIANAIKAIEYATKMGADICNISWGTTKYSAELEKAIATSDMLFIAAAGNAGEDNDNKPVYPASLSLENLISVTYVNVLGELTALSNYGLSTVDVVAPGEDIYSTVVGGYMPMNGSSMAAPQVSGVAALIYANYENIYPSNVKDIILESVKRLPNLAGKMKYPGIVSAYNALIMASDRVRTDKLAPKIMTSTVYDKGRFYIPVRVTDEGKSNIRVVLWQSGKKKIDDFGRGTKGTPVKEERVYFDKAGTYTFYASDYAGNETIRTHVIIEDIVPPTITQKIKTDSKKKTATIVVKIQDALSDVRRVKFMEGKRVVSEFLPAGTGVELKLDKEKASIKVKKNGIYSIYAIDNRGNATIRHINVKTLKK